MKLTLAVTMASMALLLSCASDKPRTIGSLQYVPLEDKETPIKPMTHEQVREEYTELLNLFEDERLKEQIERRVADVYMMESVQDQTQQQQQPTNHYVDAIKAYRNILDKYPNSPDNAEVLYQLAKAYDMEGEHEEAMAMLVQLTSRHPNYVNVAEAHFRMGDLHFNNQNYRAAQVSYLAVTGYNKPQLTTNARYMLGWAYYKQAQFKNSLGEFALVLDGLLGQATDIEQLDKAQQPLAADTVNAMSLALDKLGGAEAVASVTTIAGKSYVWMIYDSLGEYYLEKELYEKSAATFRLFVDRHSNSEKAPILHDKIIDTYTKGGFPSLALQEKEVYVDAYGIHSSYTGNRQGLQPHIAESLMTYLDELARYHYTQGQALQEQSAKAESATDDADDKESLQPVAALSRQSIRSFDKAAGFYREYADTFPQDQRIDEVYFLMSESLFLAERYEEATLGYEQVAYHPKGDSAREHAANAGYAAIIAYQAHIARLTPESDNTKVWQSKAVESMLRFAATFHGDERAVSVLTNAAEYLFSLDQYQRAIEVSSKLIATNEALDKTLKKTAFGIIAHSYFNLGDYHNAEVHYVQQRALIAPDSEEYADVSERLATAMYKKSQQIDASGESAAAVAQLLNIKVLTPKSELRVPAQYEAATMLLSMEQWAKAITELNELASLFPEHELSIEFPRRLAFAHEKNEAWALAATSYRRLAEQDPDAEVRREALFLAATMFERDKNYNAAIEHFKQYANSYEQPYGTLMEARYNLAVNYERVGDTSKQLFWLKKILEGEQAYAKTDRNRWLASWANVQYGDYYTGEFLRYQLHLPLVKSLPKKNELMNNASERYEAAASFGVLEFVTMSSFKIAELYRQLALDLRSAPQPALSAAEKPIYQQIIEEQAQPFDQLSAQLYQANIDRAWSGEYNEWIGRSFEAMRVLNPTRFNKTELIVSYGDEIR